MIRDRASTGDVATQLNHNPFTLVGQMSGPIWMILILPQRTIARVHPLVV